MRRMNFEYKKEFFDRTYTAREAYGRVWGYARKYKFRIFVELYAANGVYRKLCDMQRTT